MKQPRKTYRVWRDDGFSTMTMAVSEKQAISQVAYRAARQDGCRGNGVWRRDGIELSYYHCELVGAAETPGYRQEAFC